MFTPEHRLKAQLAATEARKSCATQGEIIETALPGLDMTRKANILARLEEMPKSSWKTYIRAMSGKSVRAGVRAFCMECVCWQRQEVRACTAPACPLFPYRPYK